MYEYKAFVNRVIDGDTYDMTIDLGFKNSTRWNIRLHDCDTPETWRPKSEAEAEHGSRATAFVKDLIEGKEVVLVSYKAAVYGRWEAAITLQDGRDLATLLVENDLIKLSQEEYQAM